MKTCKSYEMAGKELNSRTASLEGKLGDLLRNHEERAHQFAWSLTGNSEEAKELVQEASYRALRRVEKYDPLKSFGSWYLTIVRNLFVDARRARKRTVSMDQDGVDERGSLSEILPERELGIPEQLERKELALAAREALAGLGAKYRAVVRLCDMEGMRYEDAAQKLGIPEGTVRSRLFRARMALRRDPKIQWLA